MGPTNPTSPNSDHDLDHDPQAPATSRLHAGVYILLIIFSAWFALAVWIFAGRGLTDYLLFIVSGFVFVVVTLQLILSRVGRTAKAGKGNDNWASFRAWAINVARPAQRRAGGGAYFVADCRRSPRHDCFRHYLLYHRTRRELATARLMRPPLCRLQRLVSDKVAR